MEESRGAYELLSRADRLLRYLDGKRGPVPLAEELRALGLYREIVNLCLPNSLELRVPFPQERAASLTAGRGTLVAAAEELLGPVRSSAGTDGPAALSLELLDGKTCELRCGGDGAQQRRRVALEGTHDFGAHSG